MIKKTLFYYIKNNDKPEGSFIINKHSNTSKMTKAKIDFEAINAS